MSNTQFVKELNTEVFDPCSIAPYELFPDDLKQEARWLVYKMEWNGEKGKNDKIPYNPMTGFKANNPVLGVAFDVAINRLEGFSGLGIYVEPPYVVIDIDDCRDSNSGVVAPWAMEIIRQLDSYAEASPSGTGVHIWLKGAKPGAACRKGIEIYSTKRFMTVTGKPISGAPLTVNERDITDVYNRMLAGDFQNAPTSTPVSVAASQTTQGTQAVRVKAQIVPKGLRTTDLYSLLMRGTVTPEKQKPCVIEDEGGSITYDSRSEADMALCTVLALKHMGNADVIDSEFRKSPLYRQKWERDDYRDATISKAISTAKPGKAETLELTDATNENAVPDIDENSEAAIPPFDSSVVKGIYAKFVELATRGTTMSRQFSFAVVKTIVGARMAGKVKFENLDVEPRFYTTLIGETGSGKGEAYRRILQIVKPQGSTEYAAKIKIVDSADSGAGLRDLFFSAPTELPVLCYIDEAASLGNKAADTRNPAIIDQFIELADKTTVSRVLAKRGKQGGTKSKDDARLSIVMCGQSGEVFVKAFAGRTKLGWYDRLYPEYGTAVEAGDLPPVNADDAYNLLAELDRLDYSGTMKMSDDCKAFLDGFWNSQPSEVRKKARWKKNLFLDAYMSAFGRGVKTAEIEDATDAVKIFTRQLVIRRACFTSEAPDRIGYYIGLMKRIMEHMMTRLAAGVPEAAVAKSKRDFETETHAYRDNELHIFNRAWVVFQPSRLRHVTVKKANGQEYVKFVPAEE